MPAREVTRHLPGRVPFADVAWPRAAGSQVDPPDLRRPGAAWWPRASTRRRQSPDADRRRLARRVPAAGGLRREARPLRPARHAEDRDGGRLLANTNGDDLVDACVERLREGRTLVLFPEGTRSPESHLGPFQRGVAHIALRSGLHPIPVTIRCDPPAFGKRGRWHDVSDRVIEIKAEIGDPVTLNRFARSGHGAGAAVRRPRELGSR